MRPVGLITGATSGIGRAYAYALAQKGYDLILVGRRVELLKQTATALTKEYGTNVIITVLDFRIDSSFQRFLNWLDHQNIDCLINNAGYGLEQSFTDDYYTVQADMLKVHVERTLALSHLVTKKMKIKRSGQIINVCSLAAYIPLPSSAMYASTKMFLIRFSECLSLELAEYNIRVQALCPGFVYTDFHKKLHLSNDMSHAMKYIPFMTSEDVVTASLYALNITNKVIVVPGKFNSMAYLILNYCPKALYHSIVTRK